MGWELYKTPHQGVGTLCEVHINHAQGLIKRYFKPEAVTVSGRPTRFSADEISQFFATELYWLKRLKGDWVPELVDVCDRENFLVQKFYGPSLLDLKPRLKKEVPDIDSQVLEMYRFFKEAGVFKRNGSLSNMALNRGKILAFDFKWATERPNGLEKELFSYDNYLVKINPELPAKLRELL